ncbi:SH3 domain containing GRB2 like 2a, endophilin A1 isoform X2 [Hemibagrus wyckioides]|uniref:SH3 domain containing GRB2 like 2a, endophilin A1 isoform X2 n=1 Tax=Hemibagrus wyckioides TaxID=337641 RepID=UPI00266C2A51|nr:SH3 domain containing GRB2 like 2a, endophilin A1 isoform X2 [Hemibagrus wyckioides]
MYMVRCELKLTEIKLFFNRDLFISSSEHTHTQTDTQTDTQTSILSHTPQDSSMSVAGLKKQLHKATQRVSEKVGGAEGTKLDNDFMDMEKKVDVTSRAVLDIMTKTTEYLQPNPATRAKMSMMSSMSKIRGGDKGPGYTQTEAVLGEAMQKFGRELGDESNFGLALIDAGEAMRELGEVKDALDMEVKQNFIDPLQVLHDKDLKEIQHHLKKLEGRRLDFDYKKKRQGKVTEDEIKQALEKFDDSKDIAEQSMFNLLESDVEQVSQLAALVQAQVNYHRQAAEILQQLSSKIDDSESHNGGLGHSRAASRSPAPLDHPCCRALYDFDPENEGELGFKEGDIITLTNQIDENWYEGVINGQSGFFPVNYVDVLVSLPH